MNVIDLLVVLGDGAQGAVKKAWLPELALRAPARIDAAHRTLLNRLDGQRNRQGKKGRADGVPMIGEQDPGREIERVERLCPMEGTRQEDEIRLGEFSAPWEQAYGDEKVSVRKKGATQFRHGDTIRHRKPDCEGRAADRKNGGPRYPASEEVPLNWNKCVRQTHRWLSIAFTVAVIVNIVALVLKKQAVWVGLSALPPLALLLFTGLYLFVLPYATKWRSGQRTD
jgi:hypothetical protein